ncbi:hypothetical protein B0T20DRAFT_470627 [Sordaria brevicollis]|uniref:Uncharacterized protein n=1 Tax=Sordaria brevicollis TaxID=83679 RepID=A0AAE0UB35_SORBR|nr:hypothetical protein B0T20DRAFT_470627 [Sordaria brevicollis]
MKIMGKHELQYSQGFNMFLVFHMLQSDGASILWFQGMDTADGTESIRKEAVFFFEHPPSGKLSVFGGAVRRESLVLTKEIHIQSDYHKPVMSGIEEKFSAFSKSILRGEKRTVWLGLVVGVGPLLMNDPRQSPFIQLCAHLIFANVEVGEARHGEVAGILGLIARPPWRRIGLLGTRGKPKSARLARIGKVYQSRYIARLGKAGYRGKRMSGKFIGLRWDEHPFEVLCGGKRGNQLKIFNIIYLSYRAPNYP